ncbi:hypothetical protein V8E53_007039 [Lactarius tabidus]
MMSWIALPSPFSALLWRTVATSYSIRPSHTSSPQLSSLSELVFDRHESPFVSVVSGSTWFASDLLLLHSYILAWYVMHLGHHALSSRISMRRQTPRNAAAAAS